VIHRLGTFAVIGLVMFVAVGASSARADWPNFRGPNHDGISSDTGFKKIWSAPPPVLWEKNIGSGFSSFACVGDKVFTCGTKSGNQFIYCLNADTGATIWEQRIEGEYPESSGGDGPRTTPTVDGDRVYVQGATGTLLCLDSNTGKRLWKTEVSNAPRWGYSGSVLIEGDLAIATAGEKGGALVAFDKRTGESKWRCTKDIAGYATPYPFTFEGKRYIVGFTGQSAIIAEAGTGNLAWRTEWKTDWNVNAATPIFHDGYLFLTSGYGTGAALFKLRTEGDKLAADEVWRNTNLRCKFQSPVLYNGNLYGSDERALQCVDFMTGERRWHKTRIKHGTVVVADEHLILLTEEGQLQIGQASPTGFEPMTTIEVLNGRCWTVPVLYGNRLYVRNLEKAVCYNLRP